MADRYDRTHRPARAPLRAATRRNWLIAAAICVVWLFLLMRTDSLLVATVILLLLLMLVATCAAGLRFLGIDRDHPWVQWTAMRPWREGRDVLQLGLRHLPDMFLVSPSGSLIAPNAVELHMNPDDLASLTDLMDLELINLSAAEVYASQVSDLGAHLGGDGPVEVCLLSDPAVPAGRYRLRQGRPVSAAVPAGGIPLNPDDGYTWGEQAGVRTAVTGLLAGEDPAPIPPLRLVTNGSVAQTSVSGALAGRDKESELVLPPVPTVSRVHARFVFAGGQWWITSLGRNGVMLNGVPVAGERAVADGDSILWGTGPEALMSRVQVG